MVQHGRRKDALVEPLPANQLDPVKSQRRQFGAVRPCVLIYATAYVTGIANGGGGTKEH